MVPLMTTASPADTPCRRALDDLVRRRDPDRYLSSRYAAPGHRAGLVALYAFESELAAIPAKVSEPTLGAMRFQWWRDALEAISASGPVPAHEVTGGLAAAIEAATLAPGALQRMIDRHEDAFESGDSARRPDDLVTAIAAHVVAGQHGWGEAITAVAPAWAAARRGESTAHGPLVPPAPVPVRPAVAHLALRRIYSTARQPGPLQARWLILRAMLTGRV